MKNTKKIFAIATLAVGLIIMIFGFVACGAASGHKASYDSTNSYYNVDSASFGADFYSYMYDASDTIVSELDDILDNTANLVSAANGNIKATDSLNNTVALTGGLLLLSIGLIVLLRGARELLDCLAEKAPAQDATEVETIPEVEAPAAEVPFEAEAASED